MTTTRKHRVTLRLALLLWSSGWAAAAPAQPLLNLAFHHLDREKGLSQGTCPFISRDSKGFVWIGTIDGLNRFDGQHVKVYRPNPSQTHALVGNYLSSACYEDPRNGDLWFTTYNAVHRYVRAYDHFDTIQLNNQHHERQVEDYYAFHFDVRQGKLWLRVGDAKSGQGFLHLFDTRTGRDSILCPLPGARSTPILDKSGNPVQVLCSVYNTPGLELIDLRRQGAAQQYLGQGKQAAFVQETYAESDTLVWLALSTGIAAFNPKTGASTLYPEQAGKPIGYSWSVQAYGPRLLFVGTRKNGLWVFDRQTRRYTQQFLHEPEDPYSLLDNEVQNLFIDRQENLWVAHWKYGLSYVNLRKNKFLAPRSGKNYSFWQFTPGPDGNIWASDPDSGLYVFRPDGRLVDTLNRFFPEIGRRLSFGNRLYFPKGSKIGRAHV